MEDTWTMLSKEPKAPLGVMTDSFIMKFDRYVKWDLLSYHYEFSLDMLRIYQHRVNWGLILERTKYPEEVLREMAPNFNENDWEIVSKYQKLSEQFITDYADNLNWENVLIYQEISGAFFVKNAHRLVDREH